MERIIELLKEIFNATEEQTKSFSDSMKAKKIYTSSEENIDIRHGKLKGQYDTLKGQYDTMSKDYETLKQSSGDNAELLRQAAEKDATIEALQKQLEETVIDSDLSVGLLSAGAKPEDIGYIKFRIKEKGPLERGEDGKVKGLDDVIAAAKTQLPAHFTGDGKKVYMENKLPANNNGGGEAEPKDLAEALQLQYEHKE